MINKGSLHWLNERAGVLLEAAIALPIFFLLLFLLSFIGGLYHSRTTLTAAVNAASRLAYPRGDEKLVGSEIIPEIQAWKISGSYSVPASLRPYLATAGEYRTAFDAHPNYYDSMVESEFPGKRLADLPEKSLYALVYVGQILQQSLGGIRYGCDPYGLNSHDCAACIIKNPSRYDETPLDPTDGPQLGDVEFNEGFIGLQCNYHPDLRLLGFIELLLRITTNSGNPAPIVFSKEMFFDFWGKQ